jgi:cell division protein FtsW (lipid II flippase)
MFDFRLDDEKLIQLRERFERVYVRQHPKPARQTSRLVRAALIVLVVASIVVSASHTIPAFLSTIEGDAHSIIKLIIALAAFAMVEVGVLVFAYVSTRRRGEAADLHINRQLRRGLLLAFALAVVANLHSVLEPRFGGTQLWGVFSFIVFVLVGVSAPTLAYIAGEVFGLTTLADEQASIDADAAWWQAFDDAWAKALEQYRRATVRTDRPLQPAVSTPDRSVHSLNSLNSPVNEPSERTVNPANGYTKQMNARDVIRAYFEQHPDQLDRNLDLLVSDIMAESGVKVGRTSVHNVRRVLKGSVNG